MLIHWLQHVEFEGLGTIADWAARRQHRLSATRLWAGETLPEARTVRMLIVMGGPMGVHDDTLYPWLRQEKRLIGEVAGSGGTMLGICLGAQLIADVCGAEVRPNRHKEIGWYPVGRSGTIPPHLLSLLPESLDVLHWHGDTFGVPPGGQLLYSSAACRNQAFALGEKIVGLQFHLEMTLVALAALIDNCGHELRPAPFVQTPKQLLADADRLAATSGVLAGLLDYLVLSANAEG